MKTALLRALLSIALLATSACSQLTPRQKLTRGLIVAGAVVAVAGGAILAGCVPDDTPGPCSASGAKGTVSVGLPLMALGAAIITTALLVREPKNRSVGPPVMRHAVGSGGDPFGPAPNQGY